MTELKYTAEFLGTQNKGQLRELCRANGIGYNGMNNEGMKEALAKVPVVAEASGGAPEAGVKVDTATGARVLPTLVAPVVAPPAAPKPGKKIQANRPEANGVKRPSDGTICAQIWDWCDTKGADGSKVTAKELRDALPALDNTTKTVQFYRWRKFNGLQGRQ